MSYFWRFCLVLGTLWLQVACAGVKQPDASVLFDGQETRAGVLRNLDMGCKTGDLIFVRDTAGMGAAIVAATGEYTHVAIVESTDSGTYVVEAVPRKGVIRRTLDEFVTEVIGAELSFEKVADVYRLTVPYDTAELKHRMISFIGRPYDDYFAPGDDRLYCSELVFECFFDDQGNPLMDTKPMNFYDADGRLPKYWQQHFERLGVAVPQGVAGTNPTDMSKSRVLKRIMPSQQGR